MLYIKADNIKFKYEQQIENIFDDVSFEISKNSRIGIVGRNGSGKTTLLDLINKKIRVSAGNIIYVKDLNTGFLTQQITEKNITASDYLWSFNNDLFQLKKKIENSDELSDMNIFSEFADKRGYEFELEIEKIMLKLNLSINVLKQTLDKLSGGEKTKLNLIAILLKRPNILFLDEPTNNLDISSLNWLESYLNDLSIPFIVISHDRRFLDNCVNTIWEIENGKLNIYSGNYSFYAKNKKTEFDLKMKLFEKQQKKIKQLKKVMQKKKQPAVKNENFKIPRSVKKNGALCKRDDGSTHSILKPGKMMKSAMAVNSRISRLLEKEKANKPFIDKKMKINFNTENIKNKFILKTENISISFNENQILDNLNIDVFNNQRLCITGDNGTGKTTFLKIISGYLKSYNGNVEWAPKVKIGYFSQKHEELNLNNTIIDEVTEGKNELQTFSRTLLGCFNIKRDMVYEKIMNLSVGQRSKVLLTKIILSDANVLILDEPTNHLEIKARKSLENALEKYNGTIIFVSHDRYFQEKIATDHIDLNNMSSG